MRIVMVNGARYTIPRNEEYVIMTEEVALDHDLVQRTRHTFFPEPCAEVGLATQHVPAGSDGIDHEWIVLPRGYLNAYLAPEEVHKASTGRRGKKVKNNDPMPGFFAEQMSKPAYTRHYSREPVPSYRSPSRQKGRVNPMTGRKLRTGTRIVFRSPETGDRHTGTVVGRIPEMEDNGYHLDSYLVCVDVHSPYHLAFPRHTGEGHGIVLDSNTTPVDFLGTGGKWGAVPSGVGVFVTKAFSCDGIKFRKGDAGRVIVGDRTRSGTPGKIWISWVRQNSKFGAEKEDSSGRMWNNVWAVPFSKLRMGFCATGHYEEMELWAPYDAVDVVYNIGDIITITGNSVRCETTDGRESAIPADTIAEIVSNYGGSRKDAWNVEIVGGCPDRFLGAKIGIREGYMSPYSTENFFRTGQSVEITAVVDFRKIPLKGMKGKVILSTDEDGDVGIEFPEDIGAGSLDGAGTEGHCVYLEASAVKSSE